MAMAIVMRMVARIFPPTTGVTQVPLLSDYDAHIKRTPKPRCAICTGFEDTTKMRAPTRGTCQGDLAADHLGSDQPRDQPGKCPCYMRSLWLYLHSGAETPGRLSLSQILFILFCGL